MDKYLSSQSSSSIKTPFPILLPSCVFPESCSREKKTVGLRELEKSRQSSVEGVPTAEYPSGTGATFNWATFY